MAQKRDTQEEIRVPLWAGPIYKGQEWTIYLPRADQILGFVYDVAVARTGRVFVRIWAKTLRTIQHELSIRIPYVNVRLRTRIAKLMKGCVIAIEEFIEMVPCLVQMVEEGFITFQARFRSDQLICRVDWHLLILLKSRRPEVMRNCLVTARKHNLRDLALEKREGKLMIGFGALTWNIQDAALDLASIRWKDLTRRIPKNV